VKDWANQAQVAQYYIHLQPSRPPGCAQACHDAPGALLCGTL